MLQSYEAQDASIEFISRERLADVFNTHSTKASKQLIGLEIETFPVGPGYTSLPYSEHDISISQLLDLFRSYWGKENILEGQNVLGVRGSLSSTITFEPGGQIELSDAPRKSMHQVADALHSFQVTLRKIKSLTGVSFLSTGFHPTWRRQDCFWMPKQRYTIMRRYMPKVGSMGRDMMLRTCTAQVNLDYLSEEDMVRKMQVAMAFQPIITAVMASSPLYEGKRSPYHSFRTEVWDNTDPQRSGFLPFVFDEDMSFERYVRYALEVPMYFIARQGNFIDAAGASFNLFLQGKSSHLQSRARREDWESHLGALFPDVRLKNTIELRGADGNTPEMTLAMTAFWVGLMYDEEALKEAHHKVSELTIQDLIELRSIAHVEGTKAKWLGKSILEWFQWLLGLSQQGLERRGIVNSSGKSEAVFLDPFVAIAEGSLTTAEQILKIYQVTGTSPLLAEILDQFSFTAFSSYERR